MSAKGLTSSHLFEVADDAFEAVAVAFATLKEELLCTVSAQTWNQVVTAVTGDAKTAFKDL